MAVGVALTVTADTPADTPAHADPLNSHRTAPAHYLDERLDLSSPRHGHQGSISHARKMIAGLPNYPNFSTIVGSFDQKPIVFDQSGQTIGVWYKNTWICAGAMPHRRYFSGHCQDLGRFCLQYIILSLACIDLFENSIWQAICLDCPGNAS